MAARSLYEVLGVERRASAQDIKRAYYKLALRLHPDARQEPNAADDARFAEVADAYAILGDVKLRQRYDTLGPWARHLGSGSAPWQQLGRDPRRVRQALEESLSQLEQQAAAFDAQRRPKRSAKHAGTLPFAVNALTTWARQRRDRALQLDDAPAPTGPCEACHGSGAAPGSRPLPCSVCQQTGTVRWHRAFIRLERPCSACQGRGQRPELPCPLCLNQPLQAPP